MTLRHMQIFQAVYQKKSITRAAEALCMTQPAVTRAIRELETYYGVRLFDRINRRLYVTEVGTRLYTYSLHILNSFDQLEKNLRNWEELGTLRIGTTLTIGNVLLPQVLCRFRRQHRQLQVRATVATGQTLQTALVDNQLDFAVVEGTIYHEDLLSRRIADDRLVMILPPDDGRGACSGLCLGDFRHDAFILRNPGSMSRSFVDHIFAMHGIALDPIMESVSTQAILQAVHAGLGISILPRQLVQQAIDSGMVTAVVLTDESFVRENHIVWHRQKFLTPSALELMDCFETCSQMMLNPEEAR